MGIAGSLTWMIQQNCGDDLDKEIGLSPPVLLVCSILSGISALLCYIYLPSLPSQPAPYHSINRMSFCCCFVVFSLNILSFFSHF